MHRIKEYDYAQKNFLKNPRYKVKKEEHNNIINKLSKNRSDESYGMIYSNKESTDSNESISTCKKGIIVEQNSILHKSSSDNSDTTYNNIPSLLNAKEYNTNESSSNKSYNIQG